MYVCTYMLRRSWGYLCTKWQYFQEIIFCLSEFIQGSAINFIGINYLATFLGTQTLGINFEEYSKLCMKKFTL